MEPNISIIARLIGEPTRARILTALMGGKALTATELAIEAEITPQTASSHLNKLVAGQLLVVRKQGRHKYFQLEGPDVAELLEKLLNITSKVTLPNIATGPSDLKLRRARVCYDHLAGELSVALYDSLVSNNYIMGKNSETFITEAGRDFFKGIGIDFNHLTKSKRPFCKSCLDWSERRNHLAGSLGQWILNDIIKKGWASKDLDSRVIQFNKKGLELFHNRYGI